MYVCLSVRLSATTSGTSHKDPSRFTFFTAVRYILQPDSAKETCSCVAMATFNGFILLTNTCQRQYKQETLLHFLNNWSCECATMYVVRILTACIIPTVSSIFLLHMLHKKYTGNIEHIITVYLCILHVVHWISCFPHAGQILAHVSCTTLKVDHAWII
jgi:hypothetical protein